MSSVRIGFVAALVPLRSAASCGWARATSGTRSTTPAMCSASMTAPGARSPLDHGRGGRNEVRPLPLLGPPPRPRADVRRQRPEVHGL